MESVFLLVLVIQLILAVMTIGTIAQQDMFVLLLTLGAVRTIVKERELFVNVREIVLIVLIHL